MKTTQSKQVNEQALSFVMKNEKRKTGNKGVPIWIDTFKDPKGEQLVNMKEVIPFGFPKGDTSVIMGMSGNGKTDWSVQQAVYAASLGYKVLYISLEQQPFNIGAKILGKVAREQSRNYLNVPYLKDDKEYELMRKKMMIEIQSSLQKQGHEMIYIVNDLFTCKEMTDYLKEKFKEDLYDLIIVDNAQNTIAREYLEYERMSREVMAAVKGKDTALIWLSQIDEKTGRSKNTRAFEEDANVVLKVYRREEKEKQEKKEKREFEVSLPNVDKLPVSYLDIVKNREGQGISYTAIEFPYDQTTGIIGTFSTMNTVEENMQKIGATFFKKEYEQIKQSLQEIRKEEAKEQTENLENTMIKTGKTDYADLFFEQVLDEKNK